MKNIILIFSIVITISSCCTKRKVINNRVFFEVVKAKNILLNNNMVYYKINFESNTNSLFYPLNVSSYNKKEKLKMIKELLAFKNDKRVCAYPVANYNPLLSTVYSGGNTKYSIQLEALFLINQIILIKPFNYSPMPVLIDNKTKKEGAIKGEIIDEAYKGYEKWLKEVEVKGLGYLLENRIYPLNDSEVSWIYSN